MALFRPRQKAGWRSDPTGRHEYRWWDGRQWTNQVADRGVQSTDEVQRAPGAAARVPGAQGAAGSATVPRTSVASRGTGSSSAGFDRMSSRERVWHDVEAYGDPVRFERAFGRVTMPTDGMRRWDVAGEGHRQDELAAIAGPKGPEGKWVERTAHLRPEPDNQYDPNAIAVDIDGRHVGYLPRDTAAGYGKLVRRAIDTHGHATCGAVINGGWRASATDEGHYGVNLYFGYRPANRATGGLPTQAPDEQRIPYNARDQHDYIQVTGEEHHQDVLEASLGSELVADRPARLAVLTLGADPKGREVVTVSIGGQRVGWLTPKMSERFGPAVVSAESKGKHLTAFAALEPSKRKGHEGELDVVLRVPKFWGRTV